MLRIRNELGASLGILGTEYGGGNKEILVPHNVVVIGLSQSCNFVALTEYYVLHPGNVPC